MNDIETIHQNSIGVAFRWKNNKKEEIQFVFRDMGFSLSLDDIHFFKKCIKNARGNVQQCNQCPIQQQCRNILLRTPYEKFDLAVNHNELQLLDDLFSGTYLKLKMQKYIYGVGKN